VKNILIIGGSYFAGRILVEELLKEKSYEISVYNRGRLPLNFEGVTELVGDRNDEERIKETIPDKEWDVLIDFCGYTPDQIDIMMRALPGTLDHYIYISTSSVYESTLDLPIREDAPKLSKVQPELGDYADYGYNKWLSECKLKTECERKQIQYTSLRPAIIYGEYNYAPRETYFFDLIRDDETVVFPKNDLALFSFVYVIDLARMIIQCLGNEKVFGRAFNVAGEELVSYRKMFEVFEEISGKTVSIQEMNIDEINEKRIPLPFPVDNHLIYSGSKISEVLGFKYTPFLDGMRRAYQYYQMVQEHRRRSQTSKTGNAD
jgi:nucleoside-diphosphate-sugar epimerase